MKLKGVRQRWQTVASDQAGRVEVEVKAEAESESETAGGGGKGMPAGGGIKVSHLFKEQAPVRVRVRSLREKRRWIELEICRRGCRRQAEEKEALTGRLEPVVRLDKVGKLVLCRKRQRPLLDEVECELADVMIGGRPAEARKCVDRIARTDLGEEVVAAVLDAAVEELMR